MDIYEKLQEYEKMLNDGVISESEYQKLKKVLYSSKMAELGIQDEVEFEDALNREIFKEAILMLENNTASSYREAISWLEKLGDWGNAASVIEQCRSELPALEKKEEQERIEREKDQRLENARKMIETQSLSDYKNAINDLEELGSWKDAEDVLKKAQAKLPEIEELDAQRRAKELKEKKHKKTVITIAAASAICIGIIVLVLTLIVIPNQKLNKAMALLDSGNYDEAYELLDSIGKNDIIESSKHDRAVKLIDSGDYDAGYKLLEEIGDQNTIAESKYTRALELISSKDYNGAYALLDGLDYKDSKDLSKRMLLLTADVGAKVVIGNNWGEDVEWQVLAKDGDKLLVISRCALDYKLYNETYESVSWETCSLRKWLNDTFIKDTFSSDEQTMIVSTAVTSGADSSENADSSDSATPSDSSSGSSQDKLFLLSTEEAKKYFSSDGARQCTATTHAITQGVNDYQGRCWWWLRSPGPDSKSASCINYDGRLDDEKVTADFWSPGVRPAMWIKIEP